MIAGPERRTAQPSIRTARLVLRPLRDDDLPNLVKLAGELDVARMVSVIPHPYTDEDARCFIARSQAGDDGPVYAIALDDSLIGCTGFNPQDDGSADFGYWIGKPYWGRGFAAEAARAALEAALAARWFSFIRAIIFDDNPRSLDIIAKLGFAPAGTDMRGCMARTGEHPCQIFRLEGAA